jgi:hypothetical protein
MILALLAAALVASPTAPLTVRTSLDHSIVQLGDPVVARVVVALDRDAVQASTLRVDPDLAPLSALSAPSTTRTVSGRLEVVTITQRVACVSAACLSSPVELPRVRVSVTSREGNVLRTVEPWPRLRPRGRVGAADLARATPRFAADTTLPPPSYRIAPSTAETVLWIVAALAAAGAVALLTVGVRRRRPAAAGDELARALRLARESEARPVEDRRRALGLLARLLPSRAASDLAWSRPAPEPPAIDALVTEVERERAG